MNRSFTTLDGKSIKVNYPKTYKDIINWLSKSSIEGNNITEEIIQALLYASPRFIFDYADDIGIHISITFNGDLFVYWNDATRESRTAPNRKIAEEQSFDQVFKIQEERL